MPVARGELQWVKAPAGPALGLLILENPAGDKECPNY